MAYALVYYYPDGTKEQYEATLAAVDPATAVDPSKNSLPEGQIFHAAGPSSGGWTIIAVHDSQESWDRFNNDILMPRIEQGIAGGFVTPPQITTIDVYKLLP
jgi:hypothetical protein